MKKLLLLFLIFPCIAVYSSEMTEDYLDIATNYCTYGKYNDALIYLNKIINLEPNNTDVIELKNAILRAMNPNSKSYLTTTNKLIQQAQNYKYAGNTIKEAETLTSNPNDFWANYIAAEEYYRTNKIKEAITYYQKAISLKPNFAQSYLRLAFAYITCNDCQSALKYLDKYLTYNSESDIAYAMRAEINLQLNNLASAEDDIKKALEKDENISYLLIEAKILYGKKDYPTAREKFNILSRNVQSSEVYKYLGLCDYALGNYTNALLNLDKAIILSDEDKSLDSKYNEVKEKLETKWQKDTKNIN